MKQPFSFGEIPGIRILIFFVSGIFLASIRCTALHPSIGIVGLLFLGYALIAWIFRRNLNGRRADRYKAFAISLLMIACGVLACVATDPSAHPQHFSTLNPLQRLIGTVNNVDSTTSGLLRFQLLATGQIEGGQRTPATGKINVLAATGAPTVKEGDLVYLRGKAIPLPAPLNPREFDYRAYQKLKGVEHQMFIGPNQLLVLEHLDERRSLRHTVEEATRYFRKTIVQYVPHQEATSIVMAMLLGDKTELTYAQKQVYADNGAMHVLAVSGLHVGLVYLVFGAVFSLLPRRFRSFGIVPVLLLFVIWAYAMLAGFAPSVTRASTMFTFIIAGKLTNRSVSIYNIIASSAILLLAVNPSWLFDVGFQLSYLALSGIVYLQPRMYRFFCSRFWLIDKIWAITTVSIAAQVATFPVGLYYFHQFPLLFLFSNLAVIPAAFLIVCGGIALLVLSWNGFVSTMIGTALCFVVVHLNSFMGAVSEVPFAVFRNLDISIVELVAIYAGIVAFLLFFERKQSGYLRWALLMVLLLSVAVTIETWLKQRQSILSIYAVRGQQAVEVIIGSRYYTWFDANLSEDEAKINYHIQPHRTHRNASSKGDVLHGPICHYETQVGSILSIRNATILIIDRAFKTRLPAPSLEVDHIVVSKNPRLYLKDLANTVSSKQVIFDHSNPKWKTDIWIKDCRQLGINCYFVSRAGAIVVDLHEQTVPWHD